MDIHWIDHHTITLKDTPLPIDSEFAILGYFNIDSLNDIRYLSL